MLQESLGFPLRAAARGALRVDGFFDPRAALSVLAIGANKPV